MRKSVHRSTRYRWSTRLTLTTRFSRLNLNKIWWILSRVSNRRRATKIIWRWLTRSLSEIIWWSGFQKKDNLLTLLPRSPKTWSKNKSKKMKKNKSSSTPSSTIIISTKSSSSNYICTSSMNSSIIFTWADTFLSSKKLFLTSVRQMKNNITLSIICQIKLIFYTIYK